MSAGLTNVHIWTGKNWMQYYAGHVGTTALLLSEMASEAISNFQQFSGGACLCMHTAHQTYNPPSVNPGSRPDLYATNLYSVISVYKSVIVS